jgi:uncharacterized membrane protein YeaQ/YmgE (transglycosylase-associated protein family)
VIVLAFVDHPIRYLIGLAFFGLIVGAIARLLVPGRQPLGCLLTMAAGVGGSVIAGVVGGWIWGNNYRPGLVASVLGAVFVVWLVSRARSNY